jgi:small subunit ribosomal protein S17
MIKDKKHPLNLEKYSSKILQGVVISAGKMHKTCIVRVDRRVTDPLYKKTINKFSKFHVHDEHNEVSVGDLVLIKESRPISKTKSWGLLKILEKTIVEKVG